MALRRRQTGVGRAVGRRGTVVSPARSKYRACPVIVDNIRFGSKAEARRYDELKLLERAGKIQRLELQPAFELHAPSGEVVGTYRGDFRYWATGHPTGPGFVEDVKGFATPVYKLKKRMVEAEHGIAITEVRRR